MLQAQALVSGRRTSVAIGLFLWVGASVRVLDLRGMSGFSPSSFLMFGGGLHYFAVLCTSKV